MHDTWAVEGSHADPSTVMAGHVHGTRHVVRHDRNVDVDARSAQHSRCVTVPRSIGELPLVLLTILTSVTHGYTRNYILPDRLEFTPICNLPPNYQYLLTVQGFRSPLSWGPPVLAIAGPAEEIRDSTSLPRFSGINTTRLIYTRNVRFVMTSQSVAMSRTDAEISLCYIGAVTRIIILDILIGLSERHSFVTISIHKMDITTQFISRCSQQVIYVGMQYCVSYVCNALGITVVLISKGKLRIRFL